jgi:hypothetical protein
VYLYWLIFSLAPASHPSIFSGLSSTLHTLHNSTLENPPKVGMGNALFPTNTFQMAGCLGCYLTSWASWKSYPTRVPQPLQPHHLHALLPAALRALPTAVVFPKPTSCMFHIICILSTCLLACLLACVQFVFERERERERAHCKCV